MQLILVVSILIQLLAAAWSLAEWRRLRDRRMGLFTALLAVMAVSRVLALLTPRGPDPAAEVASDVAALATTAVSVLAIYFFGRLVRDREAAEQTLHRINRQLRQERDLSDSIINALPGVFYLYDEGGKFRRWNRNFEEVSGYSAAEMAQRHPLDFFAGDDKHLLAERIAQVFRTGKGEAEAEFVGKSGQRTPYYFTGARAEIDGLPCLIGMGLDVTERKAAEFALRQSEERLRLFVQHAPAALAMFDRQMRYLSVSQRWLIDYRLGGGSVIGRSHYDVFPEIPERWKEIHRRGLEGEVLRSEEDQFERAEVGLQHLRWEVRPWYSPDRAVGGIVIFTEDVTDRKKAEAALRESEERLRLALDAAHLGTFDWDVPHNRITWSRWHEELWGFEPGEFQGTYEAFSSRVHPDDLPGINAEVGRCIAARERFLREFRVVWPDGSTHWIAGFGEFEFGPDGRPVRMRGAVKEVTERKQAEQERERLLAAERAARGDAEAARQQLANTLERISDAFVALDRDWRYTYVNDKAAKIFGRRREELIGRHIWTEFPEGVGQAFHLAYERAVAQQMPVETEEYYPPYDRWFENRIYPSPDGLSIAFHDITERKRAEQAVADSEHRLRSIMDSLHAFVGLLTPDGVLLYANRAPLEFAGLKEADVVGKPVAETRWWSYSPSVQAQLMDAVRRAARGETVRYDVPVRMRGDEFMTIDFTIAPLRDSGGAVTGLVPSAVDITERVRAEQALRDSRERLAVLSRQLITAQEAERRSLARELHDEIGQVLTAVHISLQQARGACPPPAWPRLDEADAIVDRAIGQVRAMSLNLRPAILDDFGLVAALRWHVERQQRPECPIDLQVRSCGLPLPPELSNTCYRVVQEALTNVGRHARARHVWIAMDHTDDKICLRVRDDGVGCDVGAVRRRAAAGQSFGILGMQERVELLGGRFTLESAGGQGTTVEVELLVPSEEVDEGPDSGGDVVAGVEPP